MDLFNIILRPTDLWEYVLHRKLTGGSSLVEVGTSTDPYFFRPSPSFSGATYSKERDKVVGGSVGWNQLVDSSTSSVTIPSGHKYFGKIGSTKTIASSSGSAISVTGGSDMLIDLTQLFGSTIADHAYSLEQSTSGKGVEFVSKLIDLTTYHAYDSGSIKSVEGLQSHDLVGFNQWDEEWEYGRYSATTGEATTEGGVRSKNFIKVIPNTSYFLACDTIASNDFRVLFYDEYKNYISANGWAYGNTAFTTSTRAEARYVKFFVTSGHYGTTYNHDICINLSSDKNGTYEPYVKHSYPIDSDVVLRGIPIVDNDGNLSYDGDEYGADGVVKRKYGVVDLGSMTWTLSGQIFKTSLPNGYTSTANTINCVCPKYIATASVANGNMWMNQGNINIVDSAYQNATAFKTAMSGVYLVYELQTPTTETASPYTNPQSVDPYGTEEYVTDGVVAVGHETTYLGKFESVGFSLGNPSAPSEDEPSEEAEEPSEEVEEEITEVSEEPTEEADE